MRQLLRTRVTPEKLTPSIHFPSTSFYFQLVASSLPGREFASSLLSERSQSAFRTLSERFRFPSRAGDRNGRRRQVPSEAGSPNTRPELSLGMARSRVQAIFSSDTVFAAGGAAGTAAAGVAPAAAAGAAASAAASGFTTASVFLQ